MALLFIALFRLEHLSCLPRHRPLPPAGAQLP